MKRLRFDLSLENERSSLVMVGNKWETVKEFLVRFCTSDFNKLITLGAIYKNIKKCIEKELQIHNLKVL